MTTVMFLNSNISRYINMGFKILDLVNILNFHYYKNSLYLAELNKLLNILATGRNRDLVR